MGSAAAHAYGQCARARGTYKRPAPLVLSVGASESQVSTTQGEGRLVGARTRVSSRQVTCGSCFTREQPAERIPRHGWAALTPEAVPWMKPALRVAFLAVGFGGFVVNVGWLVQWAIEDPLESSWGAAPSSIGGPFQGPEGWSEYRRPENSGSEFMDATERVSSNVASQLSRVSEPLEERGGELWQEPHT